MSPIAEAVFTITADITPQIDERELQRQANQLANQLNGFLAKQIGPVAIKPAAGSFKPFQQEIDKAGGVLDNFRDQINQLPRTLGNVARAGRTTFLKFSDAVNLTRREVVGFGKGIIETIRDTNLFENALDGIQQAGSAISDLPDSFETLAAQIRSGTSVIDQMAERGDRLAQLFQPLQAQGEAARTEFVELNRSIDILTGAVNSLARASGAAGSLIRDQFGQPVFNQQIQDVEELLKLLPEGSKAYSRLRGSIDTAFEKGTTDALLQELLQAKDAAQELTGPIGKIALLIKDASGGRFFADMDDEARQTAINLEQGVITQIRRLGGSELLGPIENFNARLRETRDGFRAFVNDIQPVTNAIRTFSSQGVASIVSVGDSIVNRLLGRFSSFKNEALSAEEAMNKFVGGASNLDIAFDRIGASANSAARSLGQFLGKNLLGPLQQAGPQIKAAFSTIGQDVANGLGLGIKKGEAPVRKSMVDLGKAALDSLRKILRSSSPSKATEEIATDGVKGFVNGIKSGIGTVASSAAEFAKSFVTVLGASLAGLGAVALATGKDFNVLKQVINASLPVILGSKEAAAGLLEEVNALNDTSPFARSSFLELTRVLAGFGVQAAKITPLIDAIQQTVAATGGSDQDLLELGQAFAKIQSQGRVTGEILQSFSVRGVDAVSILATGFGKTTSEMRKMISDGLVPANKAVDVLTKGLKEKFDGATEAVAKNFPGALQRVQARLRDIGGTLLTAFITPSGGGALVDFLNNMADSLSHINKNLLPQLAPLLQKVADALVVVSEKVENFVKGISGEEFGAFIEKLKPWAPLLAALAGLIPAAFGFIPVIGPIIAGLGGPFTAAAAAIAVFIVQSGKAGEVLKTTSEGLTQLKDSASSAFGFIQENAIGTAAALTGGVGLVQGFISTIGSVVAAITKPIPLLGQLGAGFAKVGGLVSKLLTPLVGLQKGFAGALGAIPKVGGVLSKLAGPFGLAISIIVQLVATSQRFRESLGRLFEAVKPVAAVIGSVLAVAIKILNEAIGALEPVFTAVVNILASVFEAFGPVVEKVQQFIGFLQRHEVIEKFFAGVKAAIEGVITVINGFIDVLDKALGPFINLPEIKVDVDADPAVAAAKKAADEWRKQQAALRKAAEDSAAAVEDNFNGATKAVELATKAQSDAIDQLRQAIDSAAGVINSVIDAARKAQEAQAAIAVARQREAEASQTVIDLQKEYTRALEDTITPANELAKAERDLRDIQKSKTSLDREEINIGRENVKLQQQLADLTGQQAAADRAGLARAEERAQINLNRAKQAELDLLNELNGANKVSLNLAGLTLDQIRAKLAAARLSSSKERKKTAQELADEKATARLDVEDAQQALDDAKSSRVQFEIDTNEQINSIKDKIRDNDERIKEIADDRADLLLDEQTQLRAIQKLREGETSQQRVILDFDQKIRDAKVVQKQAAEAIDVATKGAAIAQAEYRLKTAEAKGDVNGILQAQKDLWSLQSGDLLNSNRTLRDIMGQQLSNVQQTRDALREANAELVKANRLQGAATALQGASGSLADFETRSRTFENAVASGNDPLAIRLAPTIDKAKNDLYKSLRTALGAGAAEQKLRNQEPWLPTPAQIEAVIRKIDEIFGRTRNLRDSVRDALNLFNLSMPGFAAAKGLSPGMVHRGMNNGVGLVRMFEFGKEAVLPLTRPTDMKRIVNDPRVRPAVIRALPGFAGGFTPGDRIINEALSSPNSPLRKILQDLFEQMGLQFPGFYEGYAPGDTLSRSIMSTTKAFEASIPSNSAALSPILNALPRWSRPAAPDSPGGTDVIGELVSATQGRRSGGPANSDVYEKKAQREFASTIGEAVKVAVIEAISESGGLGGDDIDINIGNPTDQARMIAREVRRQLDKRTGKW